MKSRPSQPCAADPPQRWQRLRTLRDLRQLNEQLFDVLVAAARRGERSMQLVFANADLWRVLDSAALQRAAQAPAFLLDLNFQEDSWWDQALPVRGATVEQSASTGEVLPPALVRQALTLVWSTVRQDSLDAALLLGVSPHVIELLGALSPRDLEQVAAQHGHEMRVRWANSQRFWRGLLAAAVDGDKHRLQESHLYGLRLLAADVMWSARRSSTGQSCDRRLSEGVLA